MATATATTVTVTFDPNSINLQSDVIGAATETKAGVMTAEQVITLDQLAGGGIPGSGLIINSYTNAARPLASAVGATPGSTVVMIWNISDKQPNFSDGTNWYDADGNLT